MIIPFYIPARHKPKKWAPKEGKLLQFPKQDEPAGDFLERLRAIAQEKPDCWPRPPR